VRVSKIVLLIRSKRGADAASRWAQLRRLEVFAAFPATLLDDVIAVVAGDVALPDCGLSDACTRSLQGVTHVIHGAACVQFDMPLVDAAATNIGGALRVQVGTLHTPLH
jgi:thioester reductase-like protein